jgi:hypothetical protein
MKTPRTDRALDAASGILPCVPAADAGRDQLAGELAELRTVPSAVIRCTRVMAIIDDLLRRFAATSVEATDVLADSVARLRKLRMGLQVELNQANANAALVDAEPEE